MTGKELEKRRKDSKEFCQLLKNIPEDKKQLVFGILTGMTLCAEAEDKKTA